MYVVSEMCVKASCTVGGLIDARLAQELLDNEGI